MRTRRPPGRIESRIRKAVRAALVRGERDEVAAAAGHLGPWLSGWLNARQDATIDEICAIAKALHIPLGHALDAPDGAELDWEVFGLMARVPKEMKPVARRMVSGLVAEASVETVERAPTASSPPRRQATTEKRRRQA